MDNPALPVSIVEVLAEALRYLRHFPEAIDEGATLCLPTGKFLFISAAAVRAAAQEVI